MSCLVHPLGMPLAPVGMVSSAGQYKSPVGETLESQLFREVVFVVISVISVYT